MNYVIRPVRHDEWEKVREIRLASLQDPAAPVAFLETYENAVAKPVEFWRDRTDTAAEAATVCQFIAEDAAGRWLGTVTVLVEGPANDVAYGEAAAVNQAHLVGVYVRPEVRGTGLAEELFRVAVDWSWSLEAPPIERVRLYVHEKNPRAEAFYRRIGFLPTGASTPVPADPTARDVEYELRRGLSR
ncbi:GNAT family N-acetyltransferase [Streptomyces sp. NPDC059176]|uniref:GNAT family N-acetyltransferase n=1 Tax=unclassified Streptomyces TaxID=2593676 RepID=UPI0036826D02